MEFIEEIFCEFCDAPHIVDGNKFPGGESFDYVCLACEVGYWSGGSGQSVKVQISIGRVYPVEGG